MAELKIKNSDVLFKQNEIDILLKKVLQAKSKNEIIKLFDYVRNGNSIKNIKEELKAKEKDKKKAPKKK